MTTKHAREMTLLIACAAIGLLLFGPAAVAAPPGVAELPAADKLPAIAELPDPFLLKDGTRVKTREDWARRREELKALILYYEYGHFPLPPGNVAATELSSAASGEPAATERHLLLSIGCDKGKVEYRLDLTIPRGKQGPFPVILKGDLCWGKVPEKIRKEVVRRGYILAEFDRTQIAPDNADRTKGVYPLFPDYDWRAEAAWAWGFHRTIDYLVTLKDVDARRIAVTGHSRGGKAALLAGAFDERIALTCPNGSGAGGAGCYRVLGPKCEDLKAIVTHFPFWFHPRFKEFIDRVDRLPFDQHSLRALVAPRAQLSTEGLGDIWANPEGTQQTYVAAKEVYKFLGAAEKIGIHFRPGPHQHNEEDFAALLDFADQQFFGKTVSRKFDQLAFPDSPRRFSWSAPPTVHD